MARVTVVTTDDNKIGIDVLRYQTWVILISS